MAQMTFLAHETLHMSSLDPSNGILCLVCAQDPLEGREGGGREVLGALAGALVNPHTYKVSGK